MAKQVSAPVSGVAPATGVQDPAARRVLQDLITAHNTRNGQTEQRFLTEADIRHLSQQIVSEGMRRLATSISSAGGDLPGAPGWGTVGDLVEAVGQIVERSPLWEALGARIEWLNRQNSLSIGKIATLADGFTQEREERLDGQSTLAREVSAVKVTAGENTAAILEEKEVRANAVNALVQAVNTMFAAVGNNSALIQDGGNLSVNWNASQATKWSQMQTEVFGADGTPIRQALAKEAQLRADRDGKLAAHYTVKIDQNGWVSGFGLMSLTSPNSNPTSAFYVRADRFAIGSPSQPAPSGATPPAENIPFVVQTTSTIDPVTGVPIPAGVYLKDAFIQNASIDTLHLAGNAVSVSAFATGGSYVATTINIPAGQTYRVVGIAEFWGWHTGKGNLIDEGISVYQTFSVNGVASARRAIVGADGHVTWDHTMVHGRFVTGPKTLKVSASGPTAIMGVCNLTVLAFKR